VLHQQNLALALTQDHSPVIEELNSIGPLANGQLSGNGHAYYGAATGT
jgi:hypothetical protein